MLRDARHEDAAVVVHRVAHDRRHHRVAFMIVDVEIHGLGRAELVLDAIADGEAHAFLVDGERRERMIAHDFRVVGGGGVRRTRGDGDAGGERSTRSAGGAHWRAATATGSGPAPSPAPVLGQHRPALVVAPAARDLHVAAGVPFAGESRAAQQRDRARVHRAGRWPRPDAASTCGTPRPASAPIPRSCSRCRRAARGRSSRDTRCRNCRGRFRSG